MDLPPLVYLTFDSVREGVGASQVLPYIEGLAARGVAVTLHSYEKEAPDPDTVRKLRGKGVRWVARTFGRPGSAGGALRVLRGIPLVRGANLVHARSDLPAASAMLARVPRWVWDVRSLWADQRIALGDLAPGSAAERILRRVEAAAARRSAGIVTLTGAAVEVLAERHGESIRDKAEVITTCVDLARFAPAPLPEGDEVRLLFSGTLNAFYDLPAMLRLAERLRARRPVEVLVATPGSTAWDGVLAGAGVTRRAVGPQEMASLVASVHAGLSVCRLDAGISLRAAMPTKIAEFLAAGRPVVVNRGLGDLDELLPPARAGVVVGSVDDDGLDEAAGRLQSLLEDPETPERCRTLAERHFSLDRGIDRLVSLYRRLAGRSSR
ncbi:MAG: glycosyltransferase [Actinomycetota bacterium]